MDLFSQYTRITNYNKLIERFITTQVKNSSRPKETGRIFTLVEILGPWNTNAHVGQSIINTFSREYFRQTNTNELINFENALKKTNEKLVSIAQNGETDWIGKINALLAVIKNDKIHIAHTGKIKAYLLRNDEIMPIIQEVDNYSYHHPLRTFSSVTSGELKSKDRIFLSTNGLFEFINSKNLQEIISDQDLLNINMQIASILKSRNIRNINCLFINMGLTEVDRNKMPEVLYIDEQQFNYFLQNLKRYFDKFVLSTGNLFKYLNQNIHKNTKEFKQYYNKNIIPQSKQLLEKSKEYSKNKLSPTLKGYSNKLAKSFNNQSSQIKKSYQNYSNKKKLSVNHYSKPYEKILLYWKKTCDFFKKLFQQTTIFTKNAFSTKNKSKTYIIIALILLAIFIANISFLQNINSNKENDLAVENILDELENKKDDALLAKLSGNNDKAKSILEELNNQVNEIPNNKKFSVRIETLKKEIQEELDKILNIDKLTEATILAEFSDIDKFFIINENIYGISNKNNKIYKKELNSNKSPEIIATIPASENNIQASAIINSNIALITQQSNLYLLEEKGLTKIEFDNSNIKSPVSIANFSNNIYTLDPGNNQIYKSINKDNKYQDTSGYLTSEYNLDGAIDMAIDGYIYILKNNGSITKFSLGKEVEFNIRNIPETGSNIKDPKKIITSEDFENIYILSGSQIYEFKKDGEFITSYKFKNEISKITDFSINPKAKELFILNDSTLYKFNLK